MAGNEAAQAWAEGARAVAQVAAAVPAWADGEAEDRAQEEGDEGNPHAHSFCIGGKRQRQMRALDSG